MDKADLKVSVINQSDLPTCRVCEAPSTGIHYGVLSCEACKTFFKRNFFKSEFYECAEDRRCEISYKNRNSCPYCRIQKCFNMGMSKDGLRTGQIIGGRNDLPPMIWPVRTQPWARRCVHHQNANEDSGKACKTGRRTREMNDSILKMKNETRECLSTKSKYACTESDHIHEGKDSCIAYNSHVPEEFYYQPISSNETRTSDEEIKSNSNIVAELTRLFEATSLDDDDDNWFLIHPSECSAQNNDLGTMCEVTQHRNWYSLPMQETATNFERNFEYIGDFKQLFDRTKVYLYDRVIERMYEKCSKCAGGVDISKGLSDKEMEHIETIELKKQIFGSLKPIPVEDYFKFYQETGLDIDGRRDMAAVIIPKIEAGVKLTINFLSSIPGFRNLCIKDKTELYRRNQFEFSMLTCQSCFNLEHKVYCPYPGVIIHVDDLEKFEGKGAVSFFIIQQHLRELNLTERETAVIAALCAMDMDSCSLTDRHIVERSQNFLLECLFYLFDKHHSEDKTRFLRITDWMNQMKSMRKDFKKSEELHTQIYHSMLEMPPIVQALSPSYAEQ